MTIWRVAIPRLFYDWIEQAFGSTFARKFYVPIKITDY